MSDVPIARQNDQEDDDEWDEMFFHTGYATDSVDEDERWDDVRPWCDEDDSDAAEAAAVREIAQMGRGGYSDDW